MKKLIPILLVICSLQVTGQTTNEFFNNGSKLFIEGKYSEASKLYSKALDSEKSKRTLDKPEYYVLIDNLGMAYAISGNLKEAIKTLEFGVNEDAKYPMFYYNLACCYAEQNNIDESLHYLELAIKHKNNMFEGEEFPNPKNDDSFKKYVTNANFIKLVGGPSESSTFDNFQLANFELPNGYSLVSTVNCISIQARTFFKSPEIYEMFIGKIKRKEIQNFDSKDDKGTIMYFEFEENFSGNGFLEGLIWGGSKPTKEHPETYLSKGKYLIIWSFNEGSQVKLISENKISTILK